MTTKYPILKYVQTYTGRYIGQMFQQTENHRQKNELAPNPQNYDQSTRQHMQATMTAISEKSAHPDLIRPTSFRQVPHPLDTMVIALLEHLQEPHNQS